MAHTRRMKRSHNPKQDTAIQRPWAETKNRRLDAGNNHIRSGAVVTTSAPSRRANIANRHNRKIENTGPAPHSVISDNKRTTRPAQRLTHYSLRITHDET